MQLPTIPKKLPTFTAFNRLPKKHKITAAGAVAAAAVVLTVTGLEATAGAGSATAASNPAGFSVSTGTQVKDLNAQTGLASQKSIRDAAQKKTDQANAAKKAEAAKQADAAKKKADAEAAKKKAAADAADRAKQKSAANRSTKRAPVAAPKKAAAATPVKAAAKSYSNNLDGWIKQSLDILHSKGIPASYNGIHKNIIRESSGNPKAINNWDINARNGIPSKGLLQVIDPTFKTYHVSGTSWDIYDPVANITAACNYAADRYGSMDNVNSAY
ncbi:transglycosylase SLT domain-containing protein [Streptomyces sp. NPDC008139]|uniref:transglycosylase SLT domain-containing protein n=1 Tax=Streptomyces sp. NPDC008139 TaxID=3364814 RepID=UPI0036E96020